MLKLMSIKWRWLTLAIFDRAVTSPMMRWLWSDHTARKLSQNLSDYRPRDSETVKEMMSGRYLFASRLVDTKGTSPFSVKIDHQNWRTELNNFSWLRHFRDVRDEGERRFARMLVIDWISRHRKFDADMWALGLTSQRILNWLRHLNLLVEDANPEQVKLITNILIAQVQSLKMRVRLARDPLDILLARIALAAIALCDGSPSDVVLSRLHRLEALLETHIDADGMHKSRNPATQLTLLTELVTLRQAVALLGYEDKTALASLVSRMQVMPAALTLGTGELGFFNGCGQQPVDLVNALNAQSRQSLTTHGVVGGYGVLREGKAVIVADSGLIPEMEFATDAHSGASSFEFSYGNELIVGNCGPSPAELKGTTNVFRLSFAHSCPTLDDKSAANVVQKGILAGRLLGSGDTPTIVADSQDIALRMTNPSYVKQFGVFAERWLTLMSDGNTLVGQDKFTFKGKRRTNVLVSIRFHMGPNVDVMRESHEDIMRLKLPSGEIWSFLWEGATAELDDSVRQSSYFGFHQTRQIVLERTLESDAEIAWILTRSS